MPEQSSIHAYLNWIKLRIDEMDATLASLEAKADQLKTDSKAKADRLIADMKKQRDEFRAKAKALAQEGEAALRASRAQMEAQCSRFEEQVKSYFDTVGQQVEEQQAIFSDVAAAQLKAWRDAADELHRQASRVAAANSADIEAAVEQMKKDATEADARLQKLKQAGKESWSALGAALAESRNAFDRANQQAWDAVKRATR